METVAGGTFCIQENQGISLNRRLFSAMHQVRGSWDDGTAVPTVGRRIVHWIVTYDRVF